MVPRIRVPLTIIVLVGTVGVELERLELVVRDMDIVTRSWGKCLGVGLGCG